MVDLQRMTEPLLDLVRSAGKQLRRSPMGTVGTKRDDFDLVTSMDRSIQDFLRQGLSRLLPEAAFLGEESEGEDSGVELSEAEDSRESLLWVVDPIDGTRYYVHGVPFFAIVVALTLNNEPILGVIHHPVLKTTIHAFKSGGACLDGQCRRIVEPHDLQSSVCYVDTDSLRHLAEPELKWVKERFSRLLDRVHRIRMIGSASTAALCMLSGVIDSFLDITGYNPVWDSAALRLILREAGARVANIPVEAGPPRFLATCEQLWTPYRRLITQES